MDLHQKEIQGFFNVPVDNLRASPFLLQYIQEEVRQARPWASGLGSWRGGTGLSVEPVLNWGRG